MSEPLIDPVYYDFGFAAIIGYSVYNMLKFIAARRGESKNAEHIKNLKLPSSVDPGYMKLYPIDKLHAEVAYKGCIGKKPPLDHSDKQIINDLKFFQNKGYVEEVAPFFNMLKTRDDYEIFREVMG